MTAAALAVTDERSEASRRNCKNCGNCQICRADGIPRDDRARGARRSWRQRPTRIGSSVRGRTSRGALRQPPCCLVPRATLHAFSAMPCRARARCEGGVAHRRLGSIERRRVAALRFHAVLSRAVLLTGRRSMRPCTINAIGSTAARRARRECQRSAAKSGVSHLALSHRVGTCIGTPSDG